MDPRWRKVGRDLQINKTRTALVVLAIAVGVFALGMVASTRDMLSKDLTSSYAATQPASAILFLGDPFDDELVETVRRMDGVLDAEGRRNVALRLQVGPEEWRDMRLDVIHDFDDIRLNRITSEGGAWPPPEQSMLVERASLPLTNAQVGEVVRLETPDGKQRDILISGVAHDMNKQPASFVGLTYGYITFDTLEWLGYPRTYNELHLRLEGRNKEEIVQLAEQVESKVEKGGRAIFWSWVPEPGEHPAADIVEPMLMVLGVLGTLSLVLSGFLVVNTIAAMLTQQTRQIGVMKTIGARTGQIVGLYLATVLVFGLLSLLVAVPLGAVAAYAFTSYLAHLINFDLAGFRVPPQALLLEVAAGLVVPLLAALWPVLAGTRVTVREAISNNGLGRSHFGESWLDRLLIRPRSLPRAAATGNRGAASPRPAPRAPRFPRPLLLSLRNTFRRKARLALTLFTLTLAGAIFIAVFSVRASLLLTLEDFASYWNYDVLVRFARPYRTDLLAREARRVPGVVEAESWGNTSANRVRPDGREGPNFDVLAPPADSALIQASLVEGRWLLPGDQHALVLDTDILDEEPDIRVGDRVTLKVGGHEGEWQVVGIVKPTLTGSVIRFGTAYIPYDAFAETTRQVGRSDSVRVVMSHHDPLAQGQAAALLEEQLTLAGLDVRSTRTTASIRETIVYQFNILVVFLSTMAGLLALVGSLGLMGTMSINVLERTREIGVMRAIGASDGAVLQIFIVEGTLIGAISWPLGVLLALPISRLMSDVLGTQFTGAPLLYTFSLSGSLLWFGGVLLLAALSSFLPAWNAARLTVREVLAYE